MSKWIYGSIVFLACLCLFSYIKFQTYTDVLKKESADTKMRVVCTTGMVADIVRHIAGDVITMDVLMGPGVDPHLYRVKEGDVHLLAQADIVIYNGLHLEGKITDVLKVLPHAHVYAAAEILDGKKLIAVDEHLFDPHVWHDVALWKEVAQGIAALFMRVDPVNTAYYTQQWEMYERILTELDQWVKDTIATLPIEKRVLITAHDAFSYFGKTYGFEVFGLQGISTDADISTKDVQTLAHIIATRCVKAIFVESSVPQRNIQAVQYAVNALNWHVSIGGTLYSDALGDATTDASTYRDMIMHNVTTLVGGLR